MSRRDDARGRRRSTYQGTIDWTKVKASGRAFAITRVGDGLGGDNTFDKNWAAIKSVGMVRGAYQYFRAGDDPIQQADILLAKIGTPADGDLPPTLDLETLDGQSAATVVANVKKWLTYVKMKSGRTPMVYTSPGFWPSNRKPGSCRATCCGWRTGRAPVRRCRRGGARGRCTSTRTRGRFRGSRGASIWMCSMGIRRRWMSWRRMGRRRRRTSVA